MRNRFHGANGNSYHFAYFCQRSSSTEDDEWMSKASGAEKANRPKTSILFKIHWRRVVLDEGHNIKNHKCMTSMAVCRLEAESRWAVTGTPIQNDTIDLYSIIKYLHCSPFNELKVWKRWVDDKSPRGTARMNTLVKSVLLRRTKHQVDATGKPLVSLPDRQVLVHSIKLSKDEQEVYNLVSLYSKNMLTMFLQEKQDKSNGHTSSIRASASQLDPSLTGTQHPDFRRVVIGRNFKDLLIMFTLLNRPVNAGAILLMVLRLRQCCSHLSLMCELLSEDEQKDEGIELPLEEQLQNLSLCDTDESKTHEERQDRPSQLKTSFVSTKKNTAYWDTKPRSVRRYHAKISELLRYLNDLRCQSKSERPIKSVVVSQWTRMLEVVAYHLRKNGFKYDFIVGSTPPKKRAEIVEKFNIEPFGSQVMLVSLKAGGVGLNLIGGNHLFLLDQHWNPALEDQAADRIYRVGQKKDVVIHRFLCNETIEEKIVDLQKKKQLLADNVLKGGKGKKQNLTLEDLKMLFGV